MTKLHEVLAESWSPLDGEIVINPVTHGSRVLVATFYGEEEHRTSASVAVLGKDALVCMLEVHECEDCDEGGFCMRHVEEYHRILGALKELG